MKKVTTSYLQFYCLFNPGETHWVNLTYTSPLVENIFKSVSKSADFYNFFTQLLIYCYNFINHY